MNIVVGDIVFHKTFDLPMRVMRVDRARVFLSWADATGDQVDGWFNECELQKEPAGEGKTRLVLVQ